MITIGSIYSSLKPKDQRLLNYALEQSISQFVRLEGGKYIGVHVKNIRNLKPEVEVGLELWRHSMKLLDKKIIDVHPQRKTWGFTLKEIQALIGPFDILLLDSGDYLLFSTKIEGEINKFATQLANNIGHQDRTIFGPALLAKQEEIET